MDNQARKAKEMAKELPFKKKIEHFWEYYKIHTLVTIAAIIVIVSSVYVTITREKYDLELTYYGDNLFGEEEAEKLEEYFERYIDDINGDGEKNVNLSIVLVDRDDGTGEYSLAVDQKLLAELIAGVSPAYLFDSVYYEKSGPESKDTVMESGIDLRDNEELCEILNLGDEPVYWCTRALYDREQNDKDAVSAYNSAKKIEQSL